MLESVLVALGYVFVFSLVTYLVPQLLVRSRSPQNLKQKYNASWAVVTGGSSGIGRAIVEKLAAQGINVAIVAYPDAVFDKAMEEYKSAYPSCEFRKIGCDMSKRDFMKQVDEATKDVPVQIVINNAGYIKTGFFAETPFAAQLANHDVNATAAIECTHHFVRLMKEKKLPGCVTFTSSPAGFMPAPFSVLYSATKAYLTNFAESLAAEIYSDGIDVSVLHPSPVASRFYDKTHAIDAIAFFKSTATGPEVLADILFANVGKALVIDQGYYPIVVRILLRCIDVNFLAGLITSIAHYLPDFKAAKAGGAPGKKVD